MDVDDDQDAAEAVERLNEAVARSEGPRPAASPLTRAQTLDLLDAPREPVDVARYTWDERIPGVKFHLVSEDPARGVRKFLVWAKAGATSPRHDHTGDELILVLDGALRDHTGVYGPGQICHTRKGEIHREEVPIDADCVCFVVYYGDLIPVA